MHSTTMEMFLAIVLVSDKVTPQKKRKTPFHYCSIIKMYVNLDIFKSSKRTFFLLSTCI